MSKNQYVTPPPTAFKLTLLRGGQKGRRGNLLMDRHAAAKRLAMTKAQGFTLIELAIVIVIIGLLAGGVLVGRDMIRAAEIRSMSATLETYSAATHLFKDKYLGLPGDLKNATAFWGAADAGDGAGSDCFTLESTTTATCNGSGNGVIDVPTGGVGVWIYGERYSAWKHLANAGLIAGTYTGRTDSTTVAYLLTAGKNAPSAKVGGSLFFFTPRVSLSGHLHLYDGDYGNGFDLRAGNTSYSPLTAEEMWKVDSKLDDGKPAYGVVRTARNTSNWGAGCATTDVSTTAEYAISDQTVKCYFVYDAGL